MTLKAMPKPFSIEMKPRKCPTNEKTEQEKPKKRGRGKAKRQHARISEADILHLEQKPRSARPVNGFLESFSSLLPDREQKMARQASKRVLRQNF